MSFDVAVRTGQIASPSGISRPMPQRRCTCGLHSRGGECAGCRNGKQRLSRQAVHSDPAPMVPALPMSRPGDRSEREADQAAAQVMRSPAISSERPQATHMGAHHRPPGASTSAGRPLPPSTNAFMGARFGADFGHVRVHAGAEAERMNRAVGARAFTVGSDVYFGAGKFRPGTSNGKQLIAHELAHVLQQTGSAPMLQRFPEEHRQRGVPPRGFGGTTLPYQEATELLECVRIMGEQNRDYCRQQVLGEAAGPSAGGSDSGERTETTLLLPRVRARGADLRPGARPIAGEESAGREAFAEPSTQESTQDEEEGMRAIEAVEHEAGPEGITTHVSLEVHDLFERTLPGFSLTFADLRGQWFPEFRAGLTFSPSMGAVSGFRVTPELSARLLAISIAVAGRRLSLGADVGASLGEHPELEAGLEAELPLYGRDLYSFSLFANGTATISPAAGTVEFSPTFGLRLRWERVLRRHR